LGEPDAAAGALGAVFAGVWVVCVAVDAAGEAIDGIFDWSVVAGPGVDVLDDDRMGEPRGDADVYDVGRTQAGDGKAAGLV